MTKKADRPIGRSRKITSWPEWPAMLTRMEELVAAGMDGRGARLLTAKEFDVPSDTLRNAVNRGDVPFIPSPNLARVQANLSGKTLYQGEPCDKCGGRERWVNDNGCTSCARDFQRQWVAQEMSSNAN